MIYALQKLREYEENWLIWLDNREVATAFKINSNKKLMNLFSSHPPLNDRIEHLEKINFKMN